MNTIFQNILAIFMAFVVMLSTMSFSVDMHYCGNTLVDVALNKAAKTCGMESTQPQTSKKTSIAKKGCCTDHKVVVTGQDELKSSKTNISLEHQMFLTTFIYAYQALFVPEAATRDGFEVYNPPLLICDIHVINQSFLI